MTDCCSQIIGRRGRRRASEWICCQHPLWSPLAAVEADLDMEFLQKADSGGHVLGVHHNQVWLPRHSGFQQKATRLHVAGAWGKGNSGRFPESPTW